MGSEEDSIYRSGAVDPGVSWIVNGILCLCLGRLAELRSLCGFEYLQLFKRLRPYLSPASVYLSAACVRVYVFKAKALQAKTAI